jgi:serine/threonine-protein phosphatase 2B catalytic subunit
MRKEDVVKIIKLSIETFKTEGNVVNINDPVTVVCDIHGQFYDLLKLFSVGGNPDTTKYLFLGDFVDRGIFAIEVMVLILSIKLSHPSTITMIRGNHECRQMTISFNFRDECIAKLDQEVYDLFIDLFDCLPISAIINGRFIAFHGGISPDLKTIAQLNKIDRFREPPASGILCDLLWSDPVDRVDGVLESDFVENDQRGCSYYYGIKSLNTFLSKNSLLSLIRGHEVQLEGYKMFNWKSKNFPQVITIFSAPNYCDTYNNKGAIIKFENNSLNIQQFHYTQHPYYLPNFMNIFEWSIPFVTEKISDMFHDIIAQEPDEENEKENVNEKESKIQAIKKKIKFIGKMALCQRMLREENENIVKIKAANDNKLPFGLLMEGKEAIDGFTKSKISDKKNEMRPALK